MNPNDLVYTNYDGIVDTLYKDATRTTKDILRNPDVSYVDLEQAKDICDSKNNMETCNRR